LWRCREAAGAYIIVVARLDRAIQYAAACIVRAIYRRGLLDATLEAEHDGHWDFERASGIVESPGSGRRVTGRTKVRDTKRVFRPRHDLDRIAAMPYLDPSVRTAHRVNQCIRRFRASFRRSAALLAVAAVVFGRGPLAEPRSSPEIHRPGPWAGHLNGAGNFPFARLSPCEIADRQKFFRRHVPPRAAAQFRSRRLQGTATKTTAATASSAAERRNDAKIAADTLIDPVGGAN